MPFDYVPTEILIVVMAVALRGGTHTTRTTVPLMRLLSRPRVDAFKVLAY